MEITFGSLVLVPLLSRQDRLQFRCWCHIHFMVLVQWLNICKPRHSLLIFKIVIVVRDSQLCEGAKAIVFMKPGWAGRGERSLSPCHST